MLAAIAVADVAALPADAKPFFSSPSPLPSCGNAAPSVVVDDEVGAEVAAFVVDSPLLDEIAGAMVGSPLVATTSIALGSPSFEVGGAATPSSILIAESSPFTTSPLAVVEAFCLASSSTSRASLHCISFSFSSRCRRAMAF
jgi:hypothetical protein